MSYKKKPRWFLQDVPSSGWQKSKKQVKVKRITHVICAWGIAKEPAILNFGQAHS